jgi:hypothetical protein
LQLADRVADHLPLLLLGPHVDQHQVGAGAEVFTVVADDQGLELVLGHLDRPPQHLGDVVVDGVEFGVGLQAQHAVAEIHEACAQVLLDDVLLVGLEGRQRDVPGSFLIAWDFLAFTSHWV